MLNSPIKNSLDSMKHYSTYQSQFIEMFGSNDCECKPLSDLTSLITKGTTPTSVGFNFEEDGIKYIKAENICEDTSINLNDCMHISQDCHNTLKRSQLQNGDLLFSIAGVIGRVGVITKECLPANTNQALAIIRFDTSKEINKEYAKHALLSPFVESQWKMKMRGAAQMNISLKDVGDINIPLPSLENQEQFCQIAEQADKSKFTSLKSQFIEMFGDVENNTKHYPVMQIKEIADTYAGATPSTSNPDFWADGTIPWMSSGEVHKGRVDQTDAMITQSGYDKCSTKMVPKHSVVIALAGQGKTRGTVAVNNIELCTNQSLCAIVPNEEIHYEYLYHNLRGRYTELRSMSGDVNGRGGLNLKHIQSIRVVVPPKEDQHKFVAIAEQADKSKYIN